MASKIVPATPTAGMITAGGAAVAAEEGTDAEKATAAYLAMYAEATAAPTTAQTTLLARVRILIQSAPIQANLRTQLEVELDALEALL
jgi:hypothetical protein